MVTDAPGRTWQDAYIEELTSLLERVAAVVDEHPEVWAGMERAGVLLRAGR